MAAGTRDDEAPDPGRPTSLALCRQGLVLLLLLWGGVDGSTAQPAVQLDTRLSADSVLVGGRFTVSFVAEHDGNVSVSFPDPATGPGTFGDIEVQRRRTVEHRSSGGRQVDSAAYEVTTFVLDSARVPPVPLQVVAGGDTSVASTPARGVKVLSVLKPSRKGIHDVAPLASFPKPLWPWILVALAVAGLLGGLLYSLWWRRAADETPSVAPGTLTEVDQTPYEAATARLRQLESYDLADPEAVKPFYVELANAVRVYVANELEVRALERTTSEVVAVLADRSDVPAEAVEQLQAVLELADLVKFAGVQPSREEHEQVLHEARAALDAIEAAPRGAEAAIDETVGAADRDD